jgi:hypothetical protein
LLEEAVAAVAVAEVVVLPGCPDAAAPVVTASRSTRTSMVRTLRAKHPASLYAWASVLGVIFA